MFRELCGNTALRNVVLVTNMWGEVSLEDGKDRENKLSSQFFKPVLDMGAQMARHHNTTRSAHEIIRRMLKNRPMALRIQRELVDQRKDIVDTAAGKAVNRELNEQMRRHQDELKGVQEEMEQVLKEKDEEARQELEEDRRRLQEQIEKVKKDSDGMALDFAAEKERIAAKVEEMEGETKKRERTDAEDCRPQTNLNHGPRGAANASAADRLRLERGIERPQDRPDDSSDNSWIRVPAYK